MATLAVGEQMLNHVVFRNEQVPVQTLGMRPNSHALETGESHFPSSNGVAYFFSRKEVDIRRSPRYAQEQKLARPTNIIYTHSLC